MKQPVEVRAFKNDLANYHVKITQIKKIETRIEDLYYQLGGVRGIDPSKEPIHSPPNKDLEYALRDKITVCEAKLSLVKAEIDDIRQTLDKMERPLRKAVFEVYANGNQIRAVASKMFLSESGLRKRMNKEIEKALNY